MSFADVRTPTLFKKSQFLRLDVGEHTIRILDESATAVDTHYVISRGGKATIRCLGDDCPICNINAQLKLEHPGTYRNAQGYSAISRRHSFNVLDRTDAKVCAKCQAVIKPRGGNFPSTCTECGSFISDIKPTPVNKVYLVTVSDTVAKDLNKISKLYRDVDGEPLPLTSYDVTFVVEQGAKGRETTVQAQPQRNDVFDIDQELFDPTTAITTLSKEEIIEFLRGVSIRDIFLSRNKKDDVASSASQKEETKLEEVSKDAQDMIDKLFGKN